MKDILRNPVYYGAVSSQKCNYKFKIGSMGSKKAEDWIVVENMHEGIIDKATFQIVQQKIKSRKRVNASGNLSLFAGMIKCGDCGRALTVKKSNGSDKYLYTCSTYNKHGKRHCSQHRVDLDVLEKHVLKEIKRLATEALGYDVDTAKSIDGTESSGNAEKWLQLISEFKEIETLDVETLNKLINKIVVYETKSYEEKSREITLEIHFSFKPYDDTTTYTIEGYSKGGYAINP